MLLLRLPVLLGFATALVDESGRYIAGSDLSLLAPPDISQEDRDASVDLSTQPPEKLFKLLAYELIREEKRPPERTLGIREFQLLTELGCREKLLTLVQDTQDIAEAVKTYHLNITGTAGLYWMLHKYPDEKSWVWLLAVSQQRILRKVGHHFSRAVILALDDPSGCLSPNFRTVLMNGVATWKKIHSDYVALLWNAVAFGILGDVTSWREVDEDNGTVEEGPGGAPPNVSWSENLIFGNMWVSSVSKWTEHHSQELTQAAFQEVADLENGLAAPRAAQYVWWHRSHDGILSSFEYLRRHVFGGWPLDKGLLRGLLRHVWQPGYGERPPVSVADFGAGGGSYSEWLNATGLVQAFAFDGVQSVSDISGGRVLEVDLAAPLQLWRTFEWVLSLEVGELMPQKSVSTFLQNLRRHAEKGIILSWASEPAKGAKEGGAIAGPLGEADLNALVERETGLLFDQKATTAVRGGCELGNLAKNMAVFRVRE